MKETGAGTKVDGIKAGTLAAGTKGVTGTRVVVMEDTLAAVITEAIMDTTAVIMVDTMADTVDITVDTIGVTEDIMADLADIKVATGADKRLYCS
jgi:hypothetical protein